MSKMDYDDSTEPTMPDRISSRNEIDRTTNASIRKAIGDRLQRSMGEDAPMPRTLQRLIDALQRQDETT